MALPQSPFMHVPNAVDHVVTMKVLRGWGGGSSGDTWTIARHGDWYGVSSRYPREPYIRYVSPIGSLSVQVSRNESGSLSQLQIRRGPQDHYESHWQRNPVKTGKTRTILGEVCEVWDVARWRDTYGRTDADYSCITSDGIELAFRRLSHTGSEYFSAEAVSVERQSVLPAEVQPPPNVLDLAMWLDRSELVEPPDARKADVNNDYETVLRVPGEPSERIEGHDSGPLIRVRRRSGDWAYVETGRAGGSRELRIHNEKAGFAFSFEHRRTQTRTGTYETVETLSIEKPPQRIRADVLGWGGGTASGPSMTVLGEACQWFGISRHIHGGRDECRTPDGVVLKERLIGRGVLEDFEAVGLRRGRVALVDVLPPQDVLAPARWGLPC